MKFKMKIEAVHEGEPAVANIEVEFNKGEYVEALKQMPTIMAEARRMTVVRKINLKKDKQ